MKKVTGSCSPESVEAVICNCEGKRPRLLLHACCAPCASYVVDYLNPFFDITVFFYNPNIMPKAEFNRRLATLNLLLEHYPSVKLIVPEQCEAEFLQKIKGYENCAEGGERCLVCFELRLNATAEYLSLHSCDYEYFATTLTVSPHKNASIINASGLAAASRYGVKYLCSDFKKKNGYLSSIELSRKYNLYRQNYCGCGL